MEKEQEYLNSIIDELNLYVKNMDEYRTSMEETFRESKTHKEVLKKIHDMGDKELYTYFKNSQIMLDTTTMFNKVASFIYFQSKLGNELDLSKLTEVDRLAEYISNNKPFTVDFIVQEDSLSERDKKELEKKFEMFKENISRNFV